jgi:hypothetical protein
MKKDNFSVLGMLAMVLTFGFILSGCATGKAPTTEVSTADRVPKTIIITGFDLPMEGIKEIAVQLAEDWSDEQNTWIISVKGVAQLNGQTATAELWHDAGKGDDNWERWTGTGEYGVVIHIYPSAGKTVKEYHGGVNIKDAETTLEWSNFEFGWDWEMN